MNNQIRDLHDGELCAVAGGSLTGAVAPIDRPPPFPFLDLRFKPQPDPWRIPVLVGG